jgi:hypothetical protein
MTKKELQTASSKLVKYSTHHSRHSNKLRVFPKAAKEVSMNKKAYESPKLDVAGGITSTMTVVKTGSSYDQQNNASKTAP